MSENPYASPGLPDNQRKAPPRSSRSVRNIIAEAVLEFLAAWWFWKSKDDLWITLVFVALGLYSMLQLFRKIREDAVGGQISGPPKTS